MPVQLYRSLKNRASHMAYNSVFYNWSLGGVVPERLAVRPVDGWSGCAKVGRWLCEGALSYEGDELRFTQEGWSPNGVSDAWITHMHGFTWLRDLKAVSAERGMSASASVQARTMIESWISHYMVWDAQSWRPDICGVRLSMWLSHYDFFGDGFFDDEDALEHFQDDFFESCMRQARHLSRVLSRDNNTDCFGLGRLQALKGLLYAGIAFEGREEWIAQSLHMLVHEIDVQIAHDGGHVSRSPAQLFEALKILLDVRMVLQTGDYPLPEKIQHAIDRMGLATRFFRYNDKHFALFNGGQMGDRDCIDSALHQAHVRGKSLSSLPCTGYERLVLGRTHILMDCGAPPDWPYDKIAHAAPLAFELNSGRDRVFVNCGSHPLDAEWQDALRSTPAHSTLNMDDRNVCEVEANGHFARKHGKIKVLREDMKDAVLLEASHDGYVALNGFTHKRRIYVSEKGADIRGADILTSHHASVSSHDVAVRFHLHPQVMVSLIRDGQEALIRTSGGMGWRFHIGGGILALEDSVFMGQGCSPRKTKQLVIYGQVNDKTHEFKWALQREG